MSRHLTKREIESFRRRSLSSAELISIHHHLETCEACRDEVGQEDQLQSALIALGPGLALADDEEPFHLSPEHIAAYVSGKTGAIDAEIVESHLEDCPACSGQIQSLKEFDFQPTGMSAEEPAIGQASLRKGFRGSWLSPARWSPAHVVLFVALLVSLVTTILLQNRVRLLNARVSELEQVNDTLKEQVASLAESNDELDRLKQAQDRGISQPEEISVALSDAGGFVTLDQRGNLVGLSALPSRYEQLIKTMLTTGTPSIPANISDLAGKRETIMGAGSTEAALHLLSPLGTAVRADRPTFRWDAMAGTAEYSVDVFDSDANKVASGEPTRLTEWTPASPLRRGRAYSWEVTAIKDGKEIISPAPPAPPARFKVLDQESLNELRIARRTYARSHLVLGALYTQLGLLDEAEREFKALLAANPDSAIAAKLSRSVQSLRRR